jgi:hydroxyacylglutathione hydrolase
VLLKQYYLGCLSHASYLIGDPATGTAIVVDPQRDVDQYLEDAKEAGLRIERVVLTHFHADFVAGHLELHAATGASIHMGHRAGPDFPVDPLREGDTWSFPSLRIEFLESPGHTPEMINLVVYDLEKDPDTPHAVLTGDTLFNGDVGRPDLLVSLGYTAEELASELYDSLHKLMLLPDDTLVYPAHGAGSLCGRSLNQELVTTIGTQRATNLALQHKDRASFIASVTEAQPAAPKYFAHDADLNRRQRATLDTVLENLRPLDLDTVLQHLSEGRQVVDTRDDDAFATAHLNGAINIGLDGTYATWCGSVLDNDRPITIIAEPGKEQESATRLGRIGYDNIEGFLDGGFERVHNERPDLLRHAERDDAATLVDRLGDVTVLDVRSDTERDTLWIPGSQHIPLHELAKRITEVPRDRPVVVHCAGGYRSSLAASLLRRHGYTEVKDLRGGIDAFAAHPQGQVRTRKDGIEQVRSAELGRLLDTGFVLVDVREVHEHHEERIPGALLRPMSRLDEWAHEFDPEQPIVLQCRSGNRSQHVARTLQERGHDQVLNLSGGIIAWRGHT